MKSGVLFFTENMSLKGWDERGILSRETALYKRLEKERIGYSFVTYGNGDDTGYEGHLGSIGVICNRSGWPRAAYKTAMPFIHAADLMRADFFKSNQVRGALYALNLKKLFKKKLILRCGDIASFSAAERGFSAMETRSIEQMERQAFRNADHVIVTTDAFATYVSQRYGVEQDRLTVIPNYVDTGLFKPAETPPDGEFRVCVIAKNKPGQKNVSTLIDALEGIPGASLLVIGSAEKDAALREAASRSGIDVCFEGVIPHDRIPQKLIRSSVYVQPSRYEGHPKTVIEAMACGLPVVACDVKGMRSVIRDGETGILCGQDVESLAGAIRSLAENKSLRANLGRAARDYAVENFALEVVAAKEARLCFGLVEQGKPANGGL